MKKITFLVLLVLSFLFSDLSAQNVAINSDGSSPDGSAMLDVKSTNSGMLIPRMSQIERDNNISSPATGLIIYQTDNTPGFYYYDGSSWVHLFDANNDDNDWTISGNDMYNNNSGNVGIGTTTPSAKLEVNGDILLTSGAARSLTLEDGSGNDLTVAAADFSGTGTGGTLYLKAGKTDYGTGGSVSITGGDSDDGAGDAGNVTIAGGDENGGTGTGGNVLIYGGNDASTVGDVILAHTGSASRGNVGIGTASPTDETRLDVDHGSEDIAVRGEGEYGPTNGYLGVQGSTDFDDVTTLDISGNEIGVVGISTGNTSSENYGVYGHSNGWGGRFEHEDTDNFVELGGDDNAIRIVDGTEADGYVLTSDASGNASWEASSGGASPGGSDGCVQYNNSGSFGGETSFYWDDSNDRLGIGTSTPDMGSLVIRGSSFDAKTILRNTTGSGGMAYTFSIQTGPHAQAGLRYDASTNEMDLYDNRTGGDITFTTNSTERMRIEQTSGNIGIGTNSPSYKLHLYGTSNNAADIYSETDASRIVKHWFVNANRSWSIGQIGSAGTPNYQFRITDETDNVSRLGIDINGNITINEAYTLPNSDGTSGQVLKTDGSGDVSWADDATSKTEELQKIIDKQEKRINALEKEIEKMKKEVNIIKNAN